MVPAPPGYIGIGQASNGFFTIGGYRVQVGGVVVKINSDTDGINITDKDTGAALFSSQGYANFWNMDATRNNLFNSLNAFMGKIGTLNFAG